MAGDARRLPLTRFHLMRHGRVADAWRGLLYGDLDVPLAPAGEDEARRAAAAMRELPLCAVVSSGLARAEYGAALLRAERGLPRRDEPDLREIKRGAWAGLSPAQLETREPGALAAWYADPTRRPPGGESLDDVAKRALPCIQALAAEFEGGEVAVVCHSWVARVVAARALALPPAAAARFELPTGLAVVVDWPASADGPRPTLVAFAVDMPPSREARWFRGPTQA